MHIFLIFFFYHNITRILSIFSQKEEETWTCYHLLHILTYQAGALFCLQNLSVSFEIQMYTTYCPYIYINFVRLSFPLSGWIKLSLNVCIKVHENREKNCIFNVKEKCKRMQNKKKDQENSSWKKVWKNLLCIFIYFWRGTRRTNGSTCTRQVNSTCEHLSKSCVPFCVFRICIMN